MLLVGGGRDQRHSLVKQLADVGALHDERIAARLDPLEVEYLRDQCEEVGRAQAKAREEFALLFVQRAGNLVLQKIRVSDDIVAMNCDFASLA